MTEVPFAKLASRDMRKLQALYALGCLEVAWQKRHSWGHRNLEPGPDTQ